MTTASLPNDTNPRVWIGCLACYNEDRLVGDWFDAITADEVTSQMVHGVHERASFHDELWVFDHENLPVSGEFDPRTASLWGHLLDQVDDPCREPFAAWALGGEFVADSDGMPCLDEFNDRYRGEWPDFVSYIEELVDDCGLLADLPDELRIYFDFDSYARDCHPDYTVHNASGGGIYVFSC